MKTGNDENSDVKRLLAEAMFEFIVNDTKKYQPLIIIQDRSKNFMDNVDLSSVGQHGVKT